MKLQGLLSALIITCCMTMHGTANAALSYMTSGDMLKVWGKAEIGDVEKFSAKLTTDIKTVVLQSPDGPNWSLARDLGKQIEERKLTTVAHGACNTFTCAMMFLSGSQRMFSGAGRGEIHYVMLSFWEANTGSNHGVTPDGSTMDDVLTWWSSHTRLSGSDLRVYHESMFYSRGGEFRYDNKVFFPIDAKVSPATALHCSGEKEGKLGRGLYFSECMPVKDASALSKGIVTTNERFSHPELTAPADIQAPGPSNFAKLETPLTLPLNDKCKENYALFLALDAPRAFVVGSGGACTMRNAQSLRPNHFAMDACKKAEGAGECRFYAVDDQVVFTPFGQALPKAPQINTTSTPMPAPTLKPEHASLALARNYSKETGLTGIADQFTLEGKIVLFSTFRWEQVDWAPGPQIMEVKWFINDKLVHTSRNSKLNFQKSPSTFWTAPMTIELGAGKGRADLYANGVLLGSKPFIITAN
ncbi:hypothetical protein Q9Q94_01255 [Uliginosibacterium sp. 31-16]|uniref:hypothetical protein n=1 Tax=Uliginosibacterium sp. 31-16 TaxID=3068315 RepID=UPI00273E8163|nr:hypothetical protein [Uliginosibacterium sp. 31-16]MDP5238135.1 hypothetical protein [Uliginosibacterium sp. 31-16]